MQSPIAIHLLRRVLVAVLLLATVPARLCLAGTGLIYEVSRAGAPTSYLVGTMHSDDTRIVGVLDELVALIERVDVVAIEMVPDAVAMLAVGAATLLPMDQSLRKLIGAARFDALTAAAAQRGIPTEILDRLKPWAAAVMLGMPAAQTGQYLDLQIYLRALERGRRTLGLESAAEQLAVFDAMAPQIQLILLEEMVKNANEVPTQLEELTVAYLTGDLDLLDQVVRRQYAGAPAEVKRWLEQVLLLQRNERMIARLSGILEREAALIAVGALHLGGEAGLVAGLRRLGYRVERWSGRLPGVAPRL